MSLMNNNIEQRNPDTFLLSIKDFSFQQRFFKWQSYIRELKQTQSPYFEMGLQRFIENYPFNHTYWIMLIENILKKPKSKGPAVRMYQIALNKNPRCVKLWKHYLFWLRDNISKSDPNYLRGQFEKATRIIGTHYHADFIFQQYFVLQTDVTKKIQTMKKALVSPLKQIDKIYDIIACYIQSSEQLTVQILENIAKSSQLVINEPKTSILYGESIRKQLKLLMRKLYQPTKKHVDQRYQFEQKLVLDQYQPFQGSYDVWKSYLYFVKNSGNFQFVYPLYQRALISLCDKEAFWQDYFLILESEGNYNRALFLLRSHVTFFQNLSRQITYYWLEIQERQSPQRARQLYIELQRSQNHLQAFMRHIQLQLRAKQYNNAKTLYQTILTVFTSNINIISYITVQFAQFTTKYFRDIQFSKKLLKNYFQSSPYNQYLFIKYLQFFINHVEYKQNNKDSKDIFQQFMNIVTNGLARAMENDKDYHVIRKVVDKYMRDFVTSIFLIKAAERKIKEVQIKTQRNLNTLKRSYSQLDQE